MRYTKKTELFLSCLSYNFTFGFAPRKLIITKYYQKNINPFKIKWIAVFGKFIYYFLIPHKKPNIVFIYFKNISA